MASRKFQQSCSRSGCIARRSAPLSRTARRARRVWAFTLIELLVVVAIIGVVLAAGLPSLYQFVKKEGFRKTVTDITEVCTAARADAILKGGTSEVVFYPLDGRCEIAGSGGKSEKSRGLARSATIDDTAIIEMLDVNLREYKDAEVARVRFFSDGTCDEMRLVLRSDEGEYRMISLEITTGLVSVESDYRKWR